MTVPGARAAQRALAVLAVLLGLLAMHALASTHHAAAAAATPHTGATVLAGEVGAGVHHASAGEVDTGALMGSGASCDQNCPDLAVLCLAVLTGVGAALLLARRRAGPVPLARAGQTGRAMTPPVRHARGPDPVRELCVSRT